MPANTHIKELLKAIGFTLEDGKVNNWKKIYAYHSNYKIAVDIEKGSIDYGESITLGDKTTSNFKAAENFVVFECVNRLLDMGYKPENITLEKDFPLGHKTKGKLDILVTDAEDKAFLMIECKTWGVELDKACKKTLSDGGQIFSYFQQDKSAKYLCLYASKLDKTTVKYENAIIKVEEYFLLATNAKEAFGKWNKNLKDNGIFESWATPYNISSKALTKGSLKSLTKEDSSLIFNQFAEILRHSVVSDKPNAFNKFITLLLCKIVDEEKDVNEELQFQWIDDDTDIILQKRLSDLYKVGMERYLTKVVTDFSDKDVDDKFIGLSDLQKQEIKNIITELRLKKNNEFAFKEVFNDASFEENSKVLKEVVELLQPYKLRYNKKQQFLGDFFELLLNTSIKQEAGQFFTPVPIARFIINSIPLHQIIHNKATKGDNDFLPYIIDYACGSGHFLTEAMDEVNNAIVELNKNNNYRPEIKKNFKIWAEDDPFSWAYKFVYGIEKDYRLVKTAKVSCFLNGDGLARIFNADGLANFETDIDYKERLKVVSRTDPQDNQQFEVLVANPPYSVSAFRNTMVNGDKSFELFNRLTENSSEIECLFIERTKQLMKDGGYVGIILPSSILSNGGIYENAREILFKHFRIVAIVEFGSNTFMATGTNTVTLFLEKRNNSEWQKIQHVVDTFLANPIDVACNGIEKPFSNYVANTFKTISFADYVTLINRTPNDAIKAHDIYKDYQNWFNTLTTIKNLKTSKAFQDKPEIQQNTELDKLFFDAILPIENEKLLYFILAYPQNVIIVKSNPDGKKETEKAFLGYEFSNRRGHEGIKPYGGRTIQEATMLYDENQMLNPAKVNTYIHNAFLNNAVEVDESLQNHVFIQGLVNLMTFNRVEFGKTVSLAVKKKVVDNIKGATLGSLSLSAISGFAFKSENFSDSKRSDEYFPVIKIGNISKDGTLDLRNLQYHIFNEKYSKYLIKNNDILIALTGATVGKVALCENDDYLLNQRVLALRIEDDILKKYIFINLSNKDFYDYSQTTAAGNAQGNISPNQVLSYKIIIPLKEIQQKIVEEIEKNEKLFSESNQKIKELNESINDLFFSTAKDSKKVKFSGVATLEYGASLPGQNRISGEYPVLGSNGIVGYHNEFLIEGPSIIVGRKGSAGKITYIEKNCFPIDTTFYIKLKDVKNSLKYFYHLLKTLKLEDLAKSVGVPGLNRNDVYDLTINLPDCKIQNDVVYDIEKVEKEIAIIEDELQNFELQKQIILSKYLV